MTNKQLERAPEVWETTSYTVRRPGNTAWVQGIQTYAQARAAGADVGHAASSKEEGK